MINGMKLEDCRKEVRNIISEVFNIPLEEIQKAPTPENIKGWDSVGHWSLIEKIEAKFNISIENSDVVELLSEAAIIQYLTGKN